MKDLKDFINESMLRSRMKGYGGQASYIDFSKVRTYRQLLDVLDEFIEALTQNNAKCGVYINSTLYKPGDYSWVLDGLKHLKDFNFEDKDIIDIDSQFKYKNRFHPTISIYHNKNTMCWNMKTQTWEIN
jgi:hypothetical protein